MAVGNTQCIVEELYYIRGSIGRKHVLGMDLRILIIYTGYILAVDLAVVIFTIDHRSLCGGVNLPNKVKSRLAFQNPSRIIARVRLTEEVLVILAGNYTPVCVRIDGFLNSLKFKGHIGGVIADLQGGSDLVHAASCAFFNVMLEGIQYDCRTHGVSRKTNFLRIDTVHIGGAGVNEIDHI